MGATHEVLFLHGAGDQHAPDGSGKLVEATRRGLGAGYHVVAPDMPHADNPRHRAWRDEIARQLAAFGGEHVMVVGHSLGGSTLLHYLSEGGSAHRHHIDALFLIAIPYWGMEEWTVDEFTLPGGWASRLPAIPKIFLYHSRDDATVPFAHSERYARELPGAVHRPIDGDEHSFVGGLPQLVDDIEGPSRSR